MRYDESLCKATEQYFDNVDHTLEGKFYDSFKCLLLPQMKKSGDIDLSNQSNMSLCPSILSRSRKVTCYYELPTVS